MQTYYLRKYRTKPSTKSIDREDMYLLDSFLSFFFEETEMNIIITWRLLAEIMISKLVAKIVLFYHYKCKMNRFQLQKHGSIAIAIPAAFQAMLK